MTHIKHTKIKMTLLYALVIITTPLLLYKNDTPVYISNYYNPSTTI